MKLVLPVYLLLISTLTFQYCFSQTFYGVSGSILTPTTDVVEFKWFNAGYGYFKEEHPPKSNNFIYVHSYFLNVGLLPRLEVGLRVVGYPDPRGIKTGYDRMMSIKWRAFEETEYIPTFAVGIQDMLGEECCKKYNSFYFIASKKFSYPKQIKSNFNIGVGTKLWNNIADKSRDHRFIGVFGSLENEIFPFMSLLNEYDSEHFNTGLKFSYKNYARIKLTLNELKHFSGMVSVSYGL